MLAMTNTYGNPWQTWRAITAPWAGSVGLAIIMTIETIAGILGAIGVVVMLINIRASAAAFARGKVWMILACLAAIAVWGLGFMVGAGDWFLAWQAKQSVRHPAWRDGLFPALRAGADRGDDPPGRRLAGGKLAVGRKGERPHAQRSDRRQAGAQGGGEFGGLFVADERQAGEQRGGLRDEIAPQAFQRDVAGLARKQIGEADRAGPSIQNGAPDRRVVANAGEESHVGVRQ